METLDVTRMRVVGGNLALDFANTRSGPPDGPPDDDVLVGYPELVAWAAHVGSLDAAGAAALQRSAARSPEEAAAVLARALRVRELLDEVFRPLAHGSLPADTALASLRDEEADALGHARLVPDGRYRWSWQDDHSLSRPLRPVVHAAVDLLLTGDAGRIKGCGGCRFLYYDETKNRSRRWCSMDDCGTDEKMRRYVAARRKRSRPATAAG